jgi:carboxymethylenebutenolidase
MDNYESQAKSLLPPIYVSRRTIVMTSLATGFAMVVQPIAAQTVITTDTAGLEAGEVKVRVPDGEIPAYRAAPAAAGSYPTVLVIQEIFGVHEHIKDVTRRFAKAGYYAIAPELYARQGDVSKMTDFRQIFTEVVSKVPDRQVMGDLDASVAFARASGKANVDRLGVTGFCWGGRQVWLYAAHNPNLKAAVAWYGPLTGNKGDMTPAHPLDIAKDLKAPVLGLYGGADQGIPVAQVEQMREAAKAAGKPVEIVVYPNAPHGFHADFRPSYTAEAARDGWNRLQAWFRQHGAGIA